MDATETGGGSDEIEVAEISPESLAELMQAFGVGSSINAPSSDLNQSAKKRVSAIGTGAMIPEKPITEIGVEPSMGQDLMAGDGVVTESRVIEGYGLNLGHERPAMPTQLPYDGYGTISGASTYLLTDFLYMQRDGGDFSVSYAPQLDGYEFSPGIRLTYGNRWDSIEGYEVGVTLLETQTSHTSVASPTNSLFSWLQPRNGFDAGNLSSFNNASFHHSFHKGHYHAADFNRVNWNWDVMSTFIGLRYTGIDEMYALHSVGGGGDLGAYRLRARNHMFGPQVGGSLHYDVGRKLSFSLTAKIAGYANFYQTDTEFANNSVRLLDIQDSRADLAWGTELAFFTHLRLTPRARIRGGWELWFYDQIASSRDQLDGFVSPFSGVAARNGDEALFYGFSLGLEWFR
jgi:hypothetical protein